MKRSKLLARMNLQIPAAAQIRVVVCSDVKDVYKRQMQTDRSFQSCWSC